MTLNFALNSVFAQVQQILVQCSAHAHAVVNQFTQLSTQMVIGVGAAGGVHAVRVMTPLHPISATVRQHLNMPEDARILGVSKVFNSGLNNALNSGFGTGFANLDAALPTGGWPEAGAVEIIADEFAFAELSVFLTLLQRVTSAQKTVAWISPPHHPHLGALRAENIATDNLQIVMASGLTSLWAANRAVCAGNTNVIFYWVDAAVTVTQRNNLHKAAVNSGTLLFLMVTDADSIKTKVPLRLRIASPVKAQAEIIGMANQSLPAIIFDKPTKKMASKKQALNRTKPAFPSLNAVGYALHDDPTQTELNILPASLRDEHQGAPAVAWVTVERVIANGNATQNLAAQCSNAISIPVPISISIATTAALISPLKTRVSHAAPAGLAAAAASSIIATASQNTPDSLKPPVNRHSSACLDRLVRSEQRQNNVSAFEAAQKSALEEARRDALRLPRTVRIDMPKGISTTLKISTPSSRARELALRSLKHSVAAPVVGQSLLRRQAKNSALNSTLNSALDSALDSAPNRSAEQLSGDAFYTNRANQGNKAITVHFAQAQLA